jgi:hypothetical protein
MITMAGKGPHEAVGDLADVFPAGSPLGRIIDSMLMPPDPDAGDE